MFQKLAGKLRADMLTAMVPVDSDSLVPLPLAKGERLVASHRGRTADGARDNTLDAFELAIARGAEMIEFDVRQTKDNVLVVNHDAEFSNHAITKLTYAELRALPGGKSLATLREVVDLALGRVMLDVELKEAGYEAETLAIVRGAGFTPDLFVVTSFRDEAVKWVKILAPEVCAGLLVGHSLMRHVFFNPIEDVFPMARVKRLHADFLACSYPLADIGVLQAAALAGVPVVVWTVNDSWRLKRHLHDRHVAAVITDVPEKALKHIQHP